MKILHYYPALPKNGKYANPYSSNYRTALSKYFKITDTRPLKGFLLPLQLAFAAWRADIYIFNWIENFPYKHFRCVQYHLLILCFRIIKMRGKKLVWMFHNIHPHADANKYTESIMAYLLSNASLIIAHSREAADYAQQKAVCKVIYRCHPIVPFSDSKSVEFCSKKKYDVLIWGSILPYKGIPEFLSYLNSIHSQLSVLVVGKSKDEGLTKSIQAECNELISYSDRRLEFKDLENLIKGSSYVVFPYIGGSVSSSGALIDTIAMGGNPVGPNKGAFKDIAKEGCCHVYNDYAELVSILENDLKISKLSVSTFIRENSWENFVKSIISEL